MTPNVTADPTGSMPTTSRCRQGTSSRSIRWPAVAGVAACLSLGVASSAHAQKVITTIEELQAINSNLGGDFVLGNNIDASATSSWNSGAGFLPIGSSASPFTGVLNGNGHMVTGLYMNSTALAVGLFGVIAQSGVVQNLLLESVAVTGSTTAYSTVGALAGLNYGSVANATMTGALSVNPDLGLSIGGLIGQNNGILVNSSAAGAVAGADSGGVVGDNFGTVMGCFATGKVAGGTDGYNGAGGLVGNNYGTINTSYATGAVTGTLGRVGGLVGFNEDGTISNSYASGSVQGLGTLGTAVFNAGGLVGENNGSIMTSYSLGTVTGTSSYLIGGLVGQEDASGQVAYSYWDTVTSGRHTSAAGTGLTTIQLQSTLPHGFSPTIWSIIMKVGFPYLPLT